MVVKQQDVRWGILGTARIANKVGRAIKRAKGASLVAIASRKLALANEWAEKRGVPRAYGSYEALLDDPRVDAVYIPLPPALHLEWTTKAAERKKHVLCEKPLAANVSESMEMADACRRHGVQLMDGVMWVHHDRTPALREQLDAGTLGTLRRVTSAFSFNWAEVPKHDIRLNKDLAGGALGDLGYYCIRATLWAFGDLPTRVYATARYFQDVEMNLSGMMWFSGERMASFDCGFDTEKRQWMEVAGTKASLICDDFVLPWSEKKSRFWVHGAQGKIAEHAVGPCVQESRMIEHFSEIVRSGRLEDRWPREAIDTMRVCDWLAESARQDRPIQAGR